MVEKQQSEAAVVQKLIDPIGAPQESTPVPALDPLSRWSSGLSCFPFIRHSFPRSRGARASFPPDSPPRSRVFARAQTSFPHFGRLIPSPDTARASPLLFPLLGPFCEKRDARVLRLYRSTPPGRERGIVHVARVRPAIANQSRVPAARSRIRLLSGAIAIPRAPLCLQ